MRSVLLFLVCALPACGPAAAPTPAPAPQEPGAETVQAGEPPLRLPDTVVPLRYALTMGIAPAQPRFTGSADIDVRFAQSTRAFWIHGQNLEVGEIQAIPDGGEPIAGRWEEVDAPHGIARIVLDRAVGPGPVRLHLGWTAPFDEALEGLYRVEAGGDAYAFTQFEAIAARKAFPGFDEPRWKTPFDVTLVVPADVRAFANSRDVETTILPNGMQRVRFAPTEPLPTYLVAWAVGPLDAVEATIPPNAVRTEPLALRGICARGRGAELAYAMEHTPRIVAALEAYFGTPYPFDKLDIVAVPDFGAGAMENAGLVTFRDVLLLLGPDAPIAQRRGFAFVMAHELAHQWFGNLVTMAWWDDLWLNEAFATWTETTIVAAVFPEMHAETEQIVTALDAFGADSLASARRIRNPIESHHDIANAFDSITYSKGATVLAMFERWMGPDRFQAGVRRYLAEHARGSATAADLVGALEAESGRSLAAPMDSFLVQPGLPLVEVGVSCEAGQPARLTLAQRRYRPVGSHAGEGSGWQIPVCVRYRAAGAVHEGCTLLTGAEGSMELEGCPDWVVPNADGLGYYRWTLADDRLAQLRQAASSLGVRDRMTLADSVTAGFAAGRIPFATALSVLEPLAEAPEREVATAAMELLRLARDRLLSTDAERAAFAAYAGRLYRGQLRRLGWGPARGQEDGQSRLLRADLLWFLGTVVRDPAVRREAERRGRAWMGEGARERPGEIHPEAVSSDLLDVTLTITVQEGGAPVFDALDRLLGTSQDAMVRGRVLGALAHAETPDLRARALGLMLDPRLRVNELYRPMMAMARDPQAQDALWEWLGAHYDALAERVGPGFSGYLPLLASGFCTAERAADARAFFGPRVESTEGGPRNLETAVEEIELCAARVEHARATASQAFTTHR